MLLAKITLTLSLVLLNVKGQVFTAHPANATGIFGHSVRFTCTFEPSPGSVGFLPPPVWQVTPPSGFGVMAIQRGHQIPPYQYTSATTTSAQLLVAVQQHIPNFNQTCFECVFMTTVRVVSGKGCINIARAPLKPNALVDGIERNAIRIRWTQPWSAVPIRNYTIEVLNDEDIRLRSAFALTSGAGTHTVNGLVEGVTFRFRVRANSDAGYGAFSDIVRATPRNAPALDAQTIGIIVGLVVGVVVVIGATIGIIIWCCCLCS